MQTPREPSMEDILASIKRVIAEEKELRAAIPPSGPDADEDEDSAEDILELNSSMAAADSQPEPEPLDLGPPLMNQEAASESAASLAQLSTVAATAPPPAVSANPLEDMLKDMLRPVLKQWLDEHLPRIVDEHVKREISRITGKPL